MADYGINIGVNVQDSQLKSLTRELKELRKIEQDLAQLSKAGLVEGRNANNLRRAAKDQASKLKQETKDLAKAFTLNGDAVKESAGRLKEYSLELRDARNNFKKGSADARIFTEAITKANFTSSFKSLKNFNLEAKETARALELLTQGAKGGPQFGAFTGMQDLLAFKPANTTDALTNYSRVLEDVIIKVDRASGTYQELAARIAEVNNQLAGTPGRMGPATDLDSPEAAFQRAEFQRQQRARRNRRLKGAAGGALLSGGFPLLFGQSTTAAITGGVGGAIGGAIGGTFGFALGIVGTAIGDAIDKNLKFKKSLGDLNNAFSKAGGDAKFFAGDIDDLAKSLRITREEAMQLAASFAFLGDKKLGENAAKLFGTPQLLRSVAQIEDAASLGQALRDLSAEIGEQEAITLGNEIRGLSVKEQRLKIEEKLNQVRGRTVKLTNEELRATTRTTRRRAFRGAGSRPTQFKTAIPASELGVSEDSARFEEFLRSFQNQSAERSKTDPTIMLRKRLEIVQAQVVAEADLVALQGKQSRAARIILRQEKAIGKAKATAKAELDKFKDPEDQRLIRLRETGEIAVANLKFDREALELAEKAVEQTKNIVQPLNDQLNAIKDKAAFEREYGELIRSGVIPAVAQQTVEINKQVKEIDRLKEKQSDELDFHILNLEALKAKAETSELEAKIQAKINELLERRLELEGKAEQAKNAARDAAKTPADRIQDEMDRVEGALNNLVNPANQVILAAQAIGDAFGESFKGLIRGSMSAQEALANLFQRTADHFADMAAQIIAKQIQMKILGIGLSFFGGSSGGGDSFAGVPNSTLDSVLPSTASLANAASAGTFAAGGYVSGPTNALIGEGGQPEYVIPASKMNEAMGRYARGARGAAVIPEGDGASTEGGMGGGSSVVDVRYSVERINNVDYVTAAEFERGMNQAAKRGAELGRQGVYSDLVNKRSVRSRVGV